ncbi:ABC transporter ATP-binding protein [Candidimonas humi]|jgi:iron(III) transport system ATP-binding protein|uniref:ABC transporter ATP-binding protein n=1 Tax=Candidimonas humi TaxID=683355 RepID=A0ABV8P180_9BURK|nr:ABC transporter ATP-binding protein [Candidimonas humi]MBV6306452.1 ABC transporter ATP-binding protein [Candidimonas humi]
MRTESQPATLQVQQVQKSFGARKVLQDVDCVVEPGQVVSLLGPSGCGKTTLLRLIAGFERPDAGRISVSGQLMADGRVFVAAEKRHIGYVPQEGALFPHLSVYDNIGFGLPKGPERKRAVEHMLELTGIAELRALMPQQLSGGQQQRVALARALAPGPRMLLLDEPFNALDAALRATICQDVMALLRRLGATVLLVTHDQNEAFVSSDRVAVMRDGRIVQFDEPVRVYRRPVDVQTAQLVGSAVFLDGVLRDGMAQTALGPIAVANHCDGETAVRVMLRHEQLRLAGPEQGKAARITDIAFHGQYSSLTVVLEPAPQAAGEAGAQDGEPPLIEFLVRAHYPFEYRIGDRVGVRVLGPAMIYGPRD